MASPHATRPDPQPDRSRLVAAIGAIGYVVGVFGFTVLVSIVLTIGVLGVLFLSGTPEAFDELLSGPSQVALVAAESIVMGIGTAIVAIVSFRFDWVQKRVVGFSLPTGRQLLVGAGSVVALVALAMGLSALAEYVGVPASEHALFDEDAPATYYAGLMAVSILVIGPVEELLFRGLIQNYVRPAFGSAGAVVYTSVLFALPHLQAYFAEELPTVLVSLGLVFALSLVLGAIYERYRNVVLVMLVHGFYNAVLFGFEIVA